MKKLTFIFIFHLCFYTFSYASIIYVKPDESSTAWEGRSPVYTSINDAYKASVTNDQIWIAEGVYKFTEKITLYGKSISFYGGFAGNETALSKRGKIQGGKPWDWIHETIIEPSVSFPSNTRFMESSGNLSPYTIDGLIFQNATFSAIQIRGGGTIQNCIFRNNNGNQLVRVWGAGKIQDSYVHNNTAQTDGLVWGGGTSTSQLAQITGVYIINNQYGNGSTGSGIYSYGNLRVLNTVIAGAQATSTQRGTAIYVHGANNEFIQCLIYNNNGIPVYCNNQANFINCTLANNQADNSLIYLNNTTQIYNTILLENGTAGITGTLNKTTISNLATDFTPGISVENLFPTTFEQAGFIKPTTFKGAPLTNSPTQLEELLSANWRLKGDSPLLDSGNTSYFPLEITDLDLALNNRIQDTSIDLGTYETLIGSNGQGEEEFSGPNHFSFENNDDLNNWTAEDGNIFLSTKHYKEGNQSLEWETSGNDRLNVKFTSFKPGNSAFFYLYNLHESKDTLIIDFMKNDEVKRSATVLLNFKGWKDFDRTYAEYMNGSSSETLINRVRFTLLTESNEKKKIYLDAINFDAPINTNREYGYHMKSDREYFTTGTARLDKYSYPYDIPLDSTPEEIQDMHTVESKVKISLSATAAEINEARTFAQSLNLIQNDDGTVSGTILDTSFDGLTYESFSKYSIYTRALAAAANASNATEEDKKLFYLFIEHLLDQGISEGVKFKTIPSNYNNIRNIPPGFLAAMPVYNEEQKKEVLKMIKWFTEYGEIYAPDPVYKSYFDSDKIYTYLVPFFAYAVAQPTENESVRELKALKRYLERNTEYTSGGVDILKPDGTGFHHGTHYNNYMYSYRTWIQYSDYLKGTGYRISDTAYQKLKKAIISLYLMYNRTSESTRYSANSLSGRNPLGVGGIFNVVPEQYFKQLIEIGGDIQGNNLDEELAAAYNFFYKSTAYNVPASDYNGFYPFSYGRLGIFRSGNWVATMRSATQFSFGAEVYNVQNRFGRYQSNGSLEIIYDGATLDTSGYPVNNTGGGWDWNIIPGTTTVHTISWKDLLPGQNVSSRYDAFASAGSYAGGLASEDKQSGIFAANYLQSSHGNFSYDTQLKFRKSVFGIDGILFSLGSNISAEGTYDSRMNTATNLFQNIISEVSTPLIVNGNPVSSTYSQTVTPQITTWLITPNHTGYFIPTGNDALQVIYGEQKTPKQDGSDVTTPQTSAIAAKAFINHGFAPSSANYFFIVKPGAESGDMETLKNNAEGGSLYTINQLSDSLHSITYLPANTTAYAFFEPVSDLSFGYIKNSTTEQMVLVKSIESNEDNKLQISVANANMNDTADTTWKFITLPTSSSITLSGKWKMEGTNSQINLYTTDAEETVLEYTLNEGNPIYFTLSKEKDETLSTENIKTTEPKATAKLVTVDSSDTSIILLDNPISRSGELSVYSIEGVLLYKMALPEGTSKIDLPLSLSSGFKIIHIQDSQTEYNLKWIN